MLKGHVQQWGGLWKAEARLPQSAPGETWRHGFPGGVECVAIGTEDLRSAAAAFSPSTPCPDGLPARAFVLLSDDLLRTLSRMGIAWEAAATWPTSEAAAVTVMIPKVTDVRGREAHNPLPDDHQGHGQGQGLACQRLARSELP